MSKTVEIVIKEIEQLLQNSMESCSQKLVPFVVKEPQLNQIFACFEIFHTQNFCMNYNLFLKRNDEFESKYEALNGSTESFIPEVDAYIRKTASEVKWGDKEEANYAQRLEELLQKWFVQCWDKAGGRNSKVPTFFCFEKEYMVRDIFTHEILEETEAAGRLGYPDLKPYYG